MDKKMQKNLFTAVSAAIILIAILIIYKKLVMDKPFLPPPPPVITTTAPAPEPKYVDQGEIIELNILKEPYNIRIKNAEGKIYTAIADEYTYIKTSGFDGRGIKGLAYLQIGDKLSFNSREGVLITQKSFKADSLIVQGIPFTASDPQEIFTLSGSVKSLTQNNFVLLSDDKNVEITVTFNKDTKFFGDKLKIGAKVIVNNPMENLKDQTNIYAKYIEVL